MPGEPPPRGERASVATRSPAPAGAVERRDPDRQTRPLRSGPLLAGYAPAVVVVLVASIALRFLTRSPLWLDEAQTVNIAQRSLPHLFSALREDGSPPLLLRAAARLDGGLRHELVRGPVAVRCVLGRGAAVIGVVARRLRLLGGSPWPAVLLLATCPFAVRYASETRMYSLVLLLVLLALLAYERVWTVGGWWPTARAALVTGALVLTQYWALFLLATAGLAALIIAIWRGVRKAAILLVPMVIGCLCFVPWLPSFLYQNCPHRCAVGDAARHRGADPGARWAGSAAGSPHHCSAGPTTSSSPWRWSATPAARGGVAFAPACSPARS